MKIATTVAFLLLFVCCCYIPVPAAAWSNTPAFWHRCKAAASTAVIAATLSFTDPSVAHAAVATPPSIPPQLNLQAPTEEKPQIRLDQYNFDDSTNTEPTPIVQGLVYYANPKRPTPTDTLVITASSVLDPQETLAGAKISVSKLKMPMNFRMFQENTVSEKWMRMQNEDILVTARTCPTPKPCLEQEASLKAKGVSKLVRNLPGLPEGQTVRAAASLPLE